MGQIVRACKQCKHFGKSCAYLPCKGCLSSDYKPRWVCKDVVVIYKQHRQTITGSATMMDGRIEGIVAALYKEWEWVSVSDSMPVVMDSGKYAGVDCTCLYYTVTITAGNII